jgi:hypothetical protein
MLRSAGRNRYTYNILTTLFRNSKKNPIWTPKTINEAAKAVTNAIRLMPVDCWAEPEPSGIVDEVAAGAADVDEDTGTVVGADTVVLLIGLLLLCNS